MPQSAKCPPPSTLSRSALVSSASAWKGPNWVQGLGSCSLLVLGLPHRRSKDFKALSLFVETPNLSNWPRGGCCPWGEKPFQLLPVQDPLEDLGQELGGGPDL